MNGRPCPEQARLVAVTLGTLPEHELAALAEHLEGCSDCEARLRQLETLPDPLLGQLRHPGREVEVPPRLFAWLRLAGPPRGGDARHGRRLGRFEMLEE